MTEDVVEHLPTAQPTPFDPPEELARLRFERPLSPLAFPDGHSGWLVTSRALVRAVLADNRFSVRQELAHDPLHGGTAPPAPQAAFTNLDPPDHTRYRSLLTGQFTVRRMRALTARIQEITADCLDAMEQAGPPADLVTAFARPVPALVICELLGVPYTDRERFMRDAMIATGTVSGAEVMTAFAALQAYLHELVLAKRAHPTDDLLSGLVLAAGSELTDGELATIGAVLLGAGLDTTANMLALGTFALLQHPAQLAALRADPGLAEPAVEELLRYLSIIPLTLRVALEDVALGGEVIRAGETFVLSLAAANRDPAQFDDPDDLDVTRREGGQVAFGHGIHQCLGQQLARVEMRAALPALLARFPGLRLAVAADEVPLRGERQIGGVQQLPVTW